MSIKKEDLKKRAEKHTQEIEKKYKKETNKSIKNSVIYTEKTDKQPDIGCCKANIIVNDLDSVSSILKNHDGKTAVLNFASYKNPGGGFITGAIAQEEALCHSSNLYNILSSFDEFYKWNKENNNKGLYMNRAIYSPDIIFLDDSSCVFGVEPIKIQVDVITCAAPNRNAAVKYANVTEEENELAVVNRVKFLLDIADENDIKTLILGAFGCGVFGQNPTTVAHAFKYCLDSYNYKFANIYFSIPKGKDGNYKAFKNVFQNNNI